MPRWPTAYGPLGLPVRSGGNDSHHPTVFCYTNIELRASRWWNRRRGPDGPWSAVRARGRRDLISSAIGRPRILPPPHLLLYPPRRISTTFESTSFEAPSVFSRLSPYFLRSSTSSSPLSSVVHEPPRALNLFLQLSIRAFASDIVLAPSPFFFNFFPLPISFHSFARVFSSGSINISLWFPRFIIHSALRQSCVLQRLEIHPSSSLLNLFSSLPLFSLSFASLIYILDINYYSG